MVHVELHVDRERGTQGVLDGEKFEATNALIRISSQLRLEMHDSGASASR